MNQPRSSRGLAEILFKLARATPNGESIIELSTGKQTLPIDRGAALVDAWVQEREAGVQYEEAAWWAERKTRTTPLDETESARLELLRKTESMILRMQPARPGEPAGEANEQQGGE